MKKIAILAGIAVLSFLIVFIPGYFLLPSNTGMDAPEPPGTSEMPPQNP